MQRIIFLLGIFLFSLACGGSGGGSGAQQSVQKTRVEFVAGTTLHDALGAIAQEGQSPDAVVNVTWDEFSTNIPVSAGNLEDQKEELIAAERDQLEFLLSQFNPEDPMEAEVYEDLSDAANFLEANNDLTVESIEADSDVVPISIQENTLVASVSSFEDVVLEEETDDESSDTEVEDDTDQGKTQSVTIGQEYCSYNSNYPKACDVTGDGVTVPAGGTSTIWPTGTLQKFWLTEKAAKWFDKHGGGVELKTVINPRSVIYCGDVWNTNMAKEKNVGDTDDPIKGKNVYRDTEAHDWFTDPDHRVCSIGHLKAKNLKPNKLYWTWRSFDWAFAVELKNPQITIEWAPTDQVGLCLARYAVNKCEDGDIAWCACTRDDMPTELLLQYKYRDYAGQEVPWTKN